MNPITSLTTWYKQIKPFHFRVVIFFVVVFILCILLSIFIAFRSKGKEQWPPSIPNCPDYWIDVSGNGANCVNTKYLGTCVAPRVVSPNDSLMDNAKDIYANAQKMNFTVSPYLGSNGNCAKKKWADGCGLAWNGITFGYGETNPCD